MNLAEALAEGISLHLRQNPAGFEVQATRTVEMELSSRYRNAVGFGASPDLPDAIAIACDACLSDYQSYIVRCAASPAPAPLDLLSALNLRPATTSTGPVRRL